MNQPATLPRTMYDKILSASCQYYNITVEDIEKGKKDTESTYKRKIVTTLIRENTNMSFKRIAMNFKFTSHGSFINFYEEICFQKTKSRQIADDLRNIMDIVNTLV